MTIFQYNSAVAELQRKRQQAYDRANDLDNVQVRLAAKRKADRDYLREKTKLDQQVTVAGI